MRDLFQSGGAVSSAQSVLSDAVSDVNSVTSQVLDENGTKSVDAIIDLKSVLSGSYDIKTIFKAVSDLITKTRL